MYVAFAAREHGKIWKLLKNQFQEMKYWLESYVRYSSVGYSLCWGSLMSCNWDTQGTITNIIHSYIRRVL